MIPVTYISRSEGRSGRILFQKCLFIPLSPFFSLIPRARTSIASDSSGRRIGTVLPSNALVALDPLESGLTAWPPDISQVGRWIGGGHGSHRPVRRLGRGLFGLSNGGEDRPAKRLARQWMQAATPWPRRDCADGFVSRFSCRASRLWGAVPLFYSRGECVVPTELQSFPAIKGGAPECASARLGDREVRLQQADYRAELA